MNYTPAASALQPAAGLVLPRPAKKNRCPPIAFDTTSPKRIIAEDYE
jgi:hypothetical protein